MSIDCVKLDRTKKRDAWHGAAILISSIRRENKIRMLGRVAAVSLLASSASSTVFFEDRFDKGMGKWVVSDWKSGDMGTWTHTAGQWFGNEAEAKGIATTNDVKHHAISAKMDSAASTTGDKPLIVQFTVKHEKKDYRFTYIKSFFD